MSGRRHLLLVGLVVTTALVLGLAVFLAVDHPPEAEKRAFTPEAKTSIEVVRQSTDEKPVEVHSEPEDEMRAPARAEPIEIESASPSGIEEIVSGRVVATLDPQQLERVLTRFGSPKAYQLRLLQQKDRALYRNWLERRLEAGRARPSAAAETTRALSPVLHRVFDPVGFPDYFECSADVCVVQMTSDQASALLDTVGIGAVALPDQFVRVFDGQRQADGSFRTYFVREEIDLSGYPDS